MLRGSISPINILARLACLKVKAHARFHLIQPLSRGFLIAIVFKHFGYTLIGDIIFRICILLTIWLIPTVGNERLSLMYVDRYINGVVDVEVAKYAKSGGLITIFAAFDWKILQYI